MSELVEEQLVVSPLPEHSDLQVIQAEVEVEINDSQDSAITDETSNGADVSNLFLELEHKNEMEVETVEDLDTETSEGADHESNVDHEVGMLESDVGEILEHEMGECIESELGEELEPHVIDMAESAGPQIGETPAPEESGNQSEVCVSEDTNDATLETSISENKNNRNQPESGNETDASQDSSTPKVNRELMSILALSKEAKLDTNLTHRRKTLDKVKDKNSTNTTPTATTTVTSTITTTPIKDMATSKKAAKVSNFPVTAESELEELNVNRLEDKTPEEKGERSPRKVKKAKSVEGDSGSEKNLRKIGKMAILKPNKDIFCWRCHHDGVGVACETCPRAYHQKCLKQTITDTEHWPCPECVAILKAENTKTRSKAMKGMTLEHLCSLLKFAVKRMIQCDGSGPFMHPVDEENFPEYKNYIIQPMDLTMLEKNIKDNLYGSTQAFEADAKWILHNSIIFNSYQSKLTSTAKTIVKICKQEMAEIENCPSCYENANTKKHTWFVEVCPKPHLLVWAKLKGFPYWPAKVMSFNSSGMVDVRFFGAHDKAWVSVKDCFMYSSRDPNAGKQKRNDIMECVKELELYADNLRKIYGRVNFAQFKTSLDPSSEQKHLKIFLPNYNENKIGKDMPKIVNEDDKKSLSPGSHSDAPKLTQYDADADGCDSDDSAKSKDGDLRIVPKTRIEYRQSTGKPNWVVKPLKTIVIRKRQAADDPDTSPLKKIARIVSETDNSEDNNTNADSPSKDKKSISPQGKLKITHELIKKLENVNNEEDTDAVTGTKIENDGKKAKDKNRGKSVVEANGHSDSSEKAESPTSNSENLTITDKSIENDGDKNSNESVVQTSKDGDVDKAADSNVPEEENIDQTNIRNIIHSSLNSPPKKYTETEERASTKKRKSPDYSANTSTFASNKMVKLVPIENILQKKNDNTSSSNKNDVVALDKSKPVTKKPTQLIVLKEIRMIKEGKDKLKGNVAKRESTTTKIPLPTPIEIKDEIESEGEDDVQYMEAKRKYMSALNISERQNVPIKPKPNEIRTRSKTEERRTKSVESSSSTNTAKISDASINPEGETRKNITPHNESNREIYIKSLSKMQAPKHKARKSFPTPNYNNNNNNHHNRRIIGTVGSITKPILPKPAVASEEATTAGGATIRVIKPLQSAPNVVILPKLHYTKPPPLSMASDLVSITSPRQITSVLKKPAVEESVIPQMDDHSFNNSSANPSDAGSSSMLNNLLAAGVANSSVVAPSPSLDGTIQPGQIEKELGPLKDILPDNVTKGVSDILSHPPPKLKPKPFGVLNTLCEPGTPSNAGPASSKFNSVAQKMSDYFRALMTEIVNDLGKSSSAEATVASLKLEIEELNHKHAIELAEIRRNVSIVLKDIQKSVIEERERIINETKASCEMDALKRIDEAKSKQWCANCLKEAQFYCCWNTSYCDYPCQQKHWPKHMSKCTQSGNQNQAGAVSSNNNNGNNSNNNNNNNNSVSPAQSRSPANQQLVLTPTAPPKFGTLFTKPQKVYLKRANAPFKSQSPASHITLVESTPGNFELVGGGPIAVNGKILASTSVIEKIKSGNIVTVTAPSGGTSTESTSAYQKVTIAAYKGPNARSSTNSTDNEH